MVLAVRNGEQHLRQAVDSVLQQTFSDFELIVVNDGSNDSTATILSSYHDGRLRILHQSGCGLVASLNYGIAAARGDFIARMDHDDVCSADRFALQVAFLASNPDVALVGGRFSQIDSDGRLLTRTVELPLAHSQILSRLKAGKMALLHPAVMFRRHAAIAVGLYDRDFLYCEDDEFFVRLASRFPLANIPNVILDYRLSPSSIGAIHRRIQHANEKIVIQALKRWEQTGRYCITASERIALKTSAARKQAAPTLARSHATAFYHVRVGRAYLRGGNWKLAKQHFIKSIKLQPVQKGAYAGLLRGLARLRTV